MSLLSIKFPIEKTIGYPFNLKVFKNINTLDLRNPVTFFVGENGSGKSTLIESIALATNLPAIGSESLIHDNSLQAVKNFSNKLELSWSVKNHRGFFLRAEDFFGFIKKIKSLKNDLYRDEIDFSRQFSGYGKILAMGTARAQRLNLQKRYGELNELSHGEGFIQLFQNRLVPGGLYLFDEPEAALSPTRQLSLITLMKEMVLKDCQFIIATHSPILMAYPQARIYSFSDRGIEETRYADVEHVSLTKDFLNHPEEFLRRL